MSLLRNHGKVLPHILVLCPIIIFLLLAPIINDSYFIRQGKPIAVDIELPDETNAAQFSLDGLKVYNIQGIYQLSGWAFPMVNKNTPAGSYERQVVLQSASGNFIFSAVTTQQWDIQDAFNHLDMNVTGSGLSAMIFKGSIPRGTYQLGLIFKNKNDGSADYINLHKCITRTPNQLLLEGLESRPCRDIMQTDGMPVSVDITLPQEISDAQYNIEYLGILDEQDIYLLSGWAFQLADRSTTSEAYEQLIVLCSKENNYEFSTQNISRPDVQATFKDLGIDISKSGFSAVISQEILDNGSYKLGMIFTRDKGEIGYFYNTNKCITRTNDGLILEETGSDACNFISP